jgi:hypothetical protein
VGVFALSGVGYRRGFPAESGASAAIFGFCGDLGGRGAARVESSRKKRDVKKEDARFMKCSIMREGTETQTRADINLPIKARMIQYLRAHEGHSDSAPFPRSGMW